MVLTGLSIRWRRRRLDAAAVRGEFELTPRRGLRGLAAAVGDLESARVAAHERAHPLTKR